MNPRELILSAFFAAIVLVLIGGAVAHLTAAPGPEGSMQAAAEPSPVASVQSEGQPEAEREARYRELVAEANRRLIEQQRALDEARMRVRIAELDTAKASPNRGRYADDDGHDGHDGHDDDDDDDDDDDHDDHDRYERAHHDEGRWADDD